MTLNLEDLSRSERKKIKTSQLIIEKTLELIKVGGYEAVTMEEIARRTDIAKGTLYNYFSSKESIIHTYVEGSLKKRFQVNHSKYVALNTLEEKLVVVFNLLMEGVKKEKAIFEIFLVHQIKSVVSLRSEGQPSSGIHELLESFVKEGIRNNEISESISIRLLGELILFYWIQVVKLLYETDETHIDVDLEVEIKKMVKMLMKSIGTR